MKIEPNSLSLFNINSCSLNKKFEDLEYLLKATKKNLDVIEISESRILKDTNLSKNINIYITTHAGGTLLYINNKLSYKLRQNLINYTVLDTMQFFYFIYFFTFR